MILNGLTIGNIDKIWKNKGKPKWFIGIKAYENVRDT